MGLKLGMNAKLYRNTGTYESPAWDEIPNTKDVTLSLESSEGDATIRGNAGWRATVGSLKDASVEWQMNWDPTDEDFQAIRDAFLTDAPIELAVMDGDITTTGNQGLRASFAILRFNRNEPLEGPITADVSAKPTLAANPPSWHTVP